jgi:type IV secretion system protein VirB5
MSMRRVVMMMIALSVSLGGIPLARAQWAVVDVGAIAQLIQQIATMRDQLQTARNQLSQAQRAYESVTGSRGMENLLQNTVRNYLPSDWRELESAINQGVGTYQALSSQVRSILDANAVLTPQQLARLSPQDRAAVEAQRRVLATRQALTREALQNTSRRFSDLQELVSAIGSADDPKAVMDLQARIAAEQAMLANEQGKLQVLYQLSQAEEAAARQRRREQAIADIGSLRDLPAMGLAR